MADDQVAGDGQTVAGAIIRTVFMDMVVLSDKSGRLDMRAVDLAREAKLPLAWVHLAIEILERPDPASRSNVHGGRRIVRLWGDRREGWQIVNKSFYWGLAKGDGRGGHPMSNVSTDTRVRPSDLDRDRDREENKNTSGQQAGRPSGDDLTLALPGLGPEQLREVFQASSDRTFEDFWSQYPRREKKARAKKAWDASVKSPEDLALFERAFRNAMVYYAETIRRGESRFIPMGGTWFGSWRDERWQEDNSAELYTPAEREVRQGLTVGQATETTAEAEARLAQERRVRYQAARRQVERWIIANGRPPDPPRGAQDWNSLAVKQLQAAAIDARRKFKTDTGMEWPDWTILEDEFNPAE